MLLKTLIFIGIILATCAFFQCKTDSPGDELEKNLRLAGRNRGALEQVLQHYQARPEDSLQLRAATLLLSNIDQSFYYEGAWLHQYDVIFEQTAMRSEQEIQALKDSLLALIGSSQAAKIEKPQDLQTLSAKYFIHNIDEAFAAWQQAPWRDQVSFSTFCNYVLPYRNFSEKPEDWRPVLKNKYEYLLKDSNNLSLDIVSCKINEDLKSWFRYSDCFHDYPGRLSVSNLMKGQRGNCADMAGLAAYCMRALGVPVSIDFTPQWGNHKDGHVWNSLIINEKESLPFLGAEGNPGEYTTLAEGEGKIAKVFRRVLAAQENSVASRARRAGAKELPILLQNPRLMDVTALYTRTYHVKLPIQNRRQKFVYLCTAGKGTWEAIEGSAIDAQGMATFENMGHNILYNPMFFKNGAYTQAGVPFIITYEGQLKMLPAQESNLEKVRLHRISTFKRSDAKWEFAQYFHNSRLEGANKPDFSDAVILYTIKEPMQRWHIGQLGGPALRDRLEQEQLWEEAKINDSKSYRYVRLIFPDKQFCKVGELEIRGAGNQRLSGTPIGTVPHPAWAFDGVPGYSIIDETPQGAQWVGLDFGKPQQINHFRYLPANGEQAVQVGKTYQLFVWKGAWKSLGIKKADQHTLEFDAVPTQALFWLHCKDCGDLMERPFTYENGKQIWW